MIALPEISAILYRALHHCLVGHMNSFSTRTKLHVAPRTHFEWNATHFERLRAQLAPEFFPLILLKCREKRAVGCPTCDHRGRSLTSLRFYPHLQGEISSGYLHAWLEPELVSPAGEVDRFPAIRRVFLRQSGAPALPEQPPLEAGQRALAPGQARGTSPWDGGFRLPNAHQLPLGSPLSPDSPTL